MSKPLHQPTEKTRAEIVALRSYGVPIKEVAAYIGIDDKTLYKYYKDELDNSAIKANANVGKFLYQAASGQALTTGATYSDCVRAAMFWAKTRMGWKETNVQEHTGANGKPLIPSAKEMTTDELKAELEALGVKL
ncbi:MAG TPA: helix-turn-helix domain-containing protein [Agitococcus sp.]|nr:helix-turn-helix domain-containing protein [Agitococcus sp.]